MQDDWQSLIKLLAQTNSEVEMSQLLAFLLTPEEKVQLSKRLRLTQLMAFSTLSQREIAKQLNMSISTVTRCSNALKSLPKAAKDKLKPTN